MKKKMKVNVSGGIVNNQLDEFYTLFVMAMINLLREENKDIISRFLEILPVAG